MIVPILLIAGAAAAAAVAFWPRRAAAGVDKNPYQAQGAEVQDLVASYAGKRLGDLSKDALNRIHAHNKALAGPPPRDGDLGTMLLPDRLAAGTAWAPPDVLVRRNAAERARDLGWALGPAGDWSWASQDARFRAVRVRGQRDESFGGQLRRVGQQLGGVVKSAKEVAPFL